MAKSTKAQKTQAKNKKKTSKNSEKNAFSKRIEKRIRKDIRINSLFKKGDKIYVKDKLCRFLIDKIIGDLPKIYTKDLKKANKIVIKYTLDDKCGEFLEELFYNHNCNHKNGSQAQKKKKKSKKTIEILRTITDKEAIEFAKNNKMLFRPNKKNKKIQEILDDLEKSYPQTRFSLAKSIQALKL